MKIWALEHLMLGLIEHVNDAYNVLITEIIIVIKSNFYLILGQTLVHIF